MEIQTQKPFIKMGIIPLDINQHSHFFDDDPVRPHLSKEFRTTDNRKSFALVRENEIDPSAIICCAFCENVPIDENGLDKPGNIAVFYTVWSYAPGAGSELVNDVVTYIKRNFPQTNRFVTLSPLTKMAEKFHLRNGAFKLRTNKKTVNFEYEID